MRSIGSISISIGIDRKTSQQIMLQKSLQPTAISKLPWRLVKMAQVKIAQ